MDNEQQDERELELEESRFYEDPMYDEDTYFAERLDNSSEDTDLDEEMTVDEESATVISPDEQKFRETIASEEDEKPLDYPADEEFEDDEDLAA